MGEVGTLAGGIPLHEQHLVLLECRDEVRALLDHHQVHGSLHQGLTQQPADPAVAADDVMALQPIDFLVQTAPPHEHSDSALDHELYDAGGHMPMPSCPRVCAYGVCAPVRLTGFLPSPAACG